MIRPALLLGAVALLLGGVASAGASTGSLVGVRPADGDQSWLVMTLAAGRTAHRTALVLNLSDATQTLAIGTADGVTTAEGVFTLAGDAETPTGVGAWIRIPRRSARIARGGRLRLPVTVRVPRETPPGDYSGGIVVQAGGRTRKPTAGGLAVRVVERVGLRVYVTVPGARDGTLAVQGVDARPADAGGLKGVLGLPRRVNVRFAVRNTGNVQYPHLAGEVQLLKGGDLRASRPVDLGTLLPGGVRPVAVSMPLPEWSPGRYDVSVRIDGLEEARGETVTSVSAMRVYVAGVLFLVVASLAGYGVWRGRRAR